eukprot:425918-Prymnesium_polylepis.1
MLGGGGGLACEGRVAVSVLAPPSRAWPRALRTARAIGRTSHPTTTKRPGGRWGRRATRRVCAFRAASLLLLGLLHVRAAHEHEERALEVGLLAGGRVGQPDVVLVQHGVKVADHAREAVCGRARCVLRFRRCER